MDEKKVLEILVSAFIKRTNGFLNLGLPDQAEYEVLHDKFERIKTLISPAKTEEELEEQEMCHELYSRMKCLMAVNSNETRSFELSKVPVNVKSSKFKFSKFQPRKFALTPQNYCHFWGQYKAIHEDGTVPVEEKFQYLIQSLEPGSAAFKLVESYPPIEDNYEPMVAHLKRRYGKDELVIDSCIRVLVDAISTTQPMKKLPALVDSLHTQIRTLKSLGVGSDRFELFLYPMIEKTLPSDILAAWLTKQFELESYESDDRSEVSVNLSGKLERLMAFLDNQVENLELVQSLHQSSPAKPMPSATALVNFDRQSPKPLPLCIFCNGKHKSSICRTCLKFDVEERRKIVADKRACFICFSLSHVAKLCREQVICKLCKKRHYPIVCNTPVDGTSPNGSGEKGWGKDKAQEPNLSSVSLLSRVNNVVYLKTFTARIITDLGTKEVRLFIDDGSHRSYIRRELALSLRLAPTESIHIAQGLFGGVETPTVKRFVYDVELASLGKASPTFTLPVIEQDTICQSVTAASPTILQELARKGIQIKDTPGAEVDILIGADSIGTLLTGRMQFLQNGLVATETKIGWTVHGRLKGSRQHSTNLAMSMVCCLNNYGKPSFCELEQLGIQTPSSRDAYEYFYESVQITDEGRISVSLPWYDDHPLLSSGKALALQRLESTARRLRKLNLYNVYLDILRKWQDEKIIEEVDPNDVTTNLVHYLPHRPVLKESRTTPVRIVFDASAQCHGVSLNNCLDKGPNLIPKILPTLLVFRQKRFGVTSDIKQAFLAVEVNPNDRDVLRFFWYNDRGLIITFRHRRVVFGVGSSPFLLNAAIAYLLNEPHDDKLLHTIEILKKTFYVDNCLASFDTIAELLSFQQEAVSIMAERHFELRAWNSNAAELMNKEIIEENVLGLRWNVMGDTLAIEKPRIQIMDGEMITKRKILAVCNAIYDPLGIVAPVTLVPKIILQKVWKEKTGWDEEISIDLRKQFLDWYTSCNEIVNCRISRSVGFSEGSTLHFFCDASGTSYGACAFLVTGTDMRFVIAKARVGPVAQLSIPRLELMGACVAARLFSVVRESWSREMKVYFWSDSKVVLCWLRNDGPWKTFVGNRVKEILEVTAASQWRYVPTSLNPADVLSRGCNANILLTTQWLEGPSWLLSPDSEWPKNNFDDVVETAFTEQQVCTNLNMEKISFSVILTRKFSQYTKLVNMVAYLFRFYHNYRYRKKKNIPKRYGPLQFSELERAEKALFWVVQHDWSAEERKRCNLRYENKDGLLCLSTKITEGERYLTSPPILIDHPITQLLILHTHQKMCHGSTNVTLLALRQKVWIVRGRQLTRKVCTSCIPCRRQAARPLIPIEAALPKDRFDINVKCFQKSGVDYGGPLYLKDNQKAWIVVFTCAVFRAVHLELVTSLSTEAFLQAVRRFLARRGFVDTFYCDNATTHVGARNMIEALDWNDIQKEGAVQRLKFIFICPASPWFGGWWEIMVKAVKNVLRRCLGRACLSYEEMLTALCDSERVVNSRPLTYVSDEPDDLRPLTPAMFLNESLGSSDYHAIDVVGEGPLNDRLKYLHELRSHFKQRFQKEYITGLVHFAENKNPQRTLTVGEIVIIEVDGSKRINWPLARVLEIFPGRDGEIRVARLKTATGELLRPVRRLYPLEVSSFLGAELSSAIPKDVSSPLQQTEVSPISLPGAPTIPDTVTERVTRSGRTVHQPDRFDI